MKIDPKKLAQVWKPEPILCRLQSCRIQLALYGLLSDAENERVKRRIAKLVNEAKELGP